MRRHILYALAWALFILVLCGMPGKSIPHNSFLDLLQVDKLIHAAIFFIFSYLLLNWVTRYPGDWCLSRWTIIAVMVFSISYGGLMEVMQATMFEDRSADLIDFIANSIGAVSGALLFKKINRSFSRWKK